MLNSFQHLVYMLIHIKSLFLPSADALFVPVHWTGFSSATLIKFKFWLLGIGIYLVIGTWNLVIIVYWLFDFPNGP
jgi:hypothetical protein